MHKYIYSSIVGIFTTLIVFSLFVTDIQSSEISELQTELILLKEDVALKQERIRHIEQKIESFDTYKNKMDFAEDAETVIPQPIVKRNASASITTYWDTREYTTVSIITSTSLPYGFSIWGFTDLHGVQNEGQDVFDHSRFLMEYRLSQKISPDYAVGLKGLGWQVEYDDFNGSSNEVVRCGLTYRQNFNGFMSKSSWLQFRYFPYETNGDGQQISLIYYLSLTDRIWISGFADYNVIEGSKDRWVVEPQLNYKLSDQVTAVVEYRLNQYEQANANLKGEGIAFGLSLGF